MDISTTIRRITSARLVDWGVRDACYGTIYWDVSKYLLEDIEKEIRAIKHEFYENDIDDWTVEEVMERLAEKYDVFYAMEDTAEISI